MIDSVFRRLELKVIPVIVFAVCAALMLLFAWLWPQLAFDFSGRLGLVLALIITGLSAISFSVYTFSRANTSKSPDRPESASHLVTWGIYRFTRNPMYLGGALNALAMALLIGNYSAFLFVALFIGYINRFQIKPEERILEQKFAQDFSDYIRRTRRWI